MKEENYEYLYHLISDCEFDNGMPNSAIEFLKGLHEDDPERCSDLIYITYKYYVDDLKFLGKLCRCLCYIDINDDDPISDVAYSILKTCIESDDAYCQEGAIMLCEELRDTYCLSLLLLHLNPYDYIIKSYADSVIHELDLE